MVRVDLEPATAGRLTFDSRAPDGSPRLFVGMYRPPFEEVSSETRAPVIWTTGPADRVRQAWADGWFDQPLYREEHEETSCGASFATRYVLILQPADEPVGWQASLCHLPDRHDGPHHDPWTLLTWDDSGVWAQSEIVRHHPGWPPKRSR